MKPEIKWDGKTVWINAPDGSCIGRFSQFGIDVHHTATDQINLGTQCIRCTHRRPDLAEWNRFVDLMVFHHGVEVPDRAKPLFVVR